MNEIGAVLEHALEDLERVVLRNETNVRNAWAGVECGTDSILGCLRHVHSEVHLEIEVSGLPPALLRVPIEGARGS